MLAQQTVALPALLCSALFFVAFAHAGPTGPHQQSAAGATLAQLAASIGAAENNDGTINNKNNNNNKYISAVYWPYTFGDADVVQYIDLLDDDESESDRAKRFEAAAMPGVLRFGKRGAGRQLALIDDLSGFDGAGLLIKKEMPGVLRFGKRSVPGVLRFGKRDDIPGVLRFGKRNVPAGVLRFGRK